MKIALINLSSVDNAQMAVIATALKRSLDDACTAWERAPIDVAFFPGAKVAPEGWTPLVAFQSPGAGDEGVEGYHSVDPNGRAYGRAFVDCVPGGTVLHDTSGRGESLAGLLSHEAVEMSADILANAYQDGPFVDPQTKHSYSQVAVELADPVQELAYAINVDGQLVDCSNFVWPSWFSHSAAGVQVDQMGALKAPLTLAPGGYVIVRDVRTDKQVFAERLFGKAAVATPVIEKVFSSCPPALWREKAKGHHGGRSLRRLAALAEAASR